MIFFSLDLIRRQSITKKRGRNLDKYSRFLSLLYTIYTRKNETIIFGRLCNHLAVYIYFLKEKKHTKLD